MNHALSDTDYCRNPEITEDEQTNEAVKAQIDKLENEKESFPEKSSGILNLLIAACNSIRDEFSRAVASAATDILEPYHCDTENPDYLEFWDKTPELEAAYEQSIDCFASAGQNRYFQASCHIRTLYHP